MAAANPPGAPGIMQQTTDPLAELRDIHLPGPIETWPPAPGWWLLALLLCVALVAACVWLIKRWRRSRYRREAAAELRLLLETWQENGDDRAYLESVQRLLKRIALTTFPRENVASLTGEAWVQFLDRSASSHDFSIGASEVLIEGNYTAQVSLDVPSFHMEVQRWIRRHKPKHLERFFADHPDAQSNAFSSKKKRPEPEGLNDKLETGGSVAA